MPSAPNALTGTQAVTYTSPALPTSVGLNAIVVATVAMGSVMMPAALAPVVATMKGAVANVAVTLIAALMLNVQILFPVHSPLQPVKVDPEAGVAVSVTLLPMLKEALQVPPQLMPAGLLVTVPLPVPVRVTMMMLGDSIGTAGGDSNCACANGEERKLAHTRKKAVKRLPVTCFTMSLRGICRNSTDHCRRSRHRIPYPT